MSKGTVLISGASIAGPVCAYWLSRAGFTPTIVERASTLRTNGQQIDIRGLALELTQKMGLLEEIKAATTKEAGIAFVDGQGKRIGAFGVNESGQGGQSFSSEIEILRGKLAEVYYDATKEDTEYVFGDYITGLDEGDNGVRVTFHNGQQRKFDVVVIADGMNSRTRKLIWPDTDPVKSLGQFTSFFTIPVVDEKETWAQWYNAPGGKCVFLRPDGKGLETRAYLSKMGRDFEGYEKLSVDEQKQKWATLFKDAGWVSKTVVEGMKTSGDYYMQEIAQVKMPEWSRGRVALLGDAAYCPSPISGMGTSLAIVGAYVLAGELGKTTDHREALEQYEKILRPYVKAAQSLPPGAPAIANPQTAWGIWILNTIIGTVSWVFATFPRLAKWASANGPGKEKLQLPEYDAVAKT